MYRGPWIVWEAPDPSADGLGDSLAVRPDLFASASRRIDREIALKPDGNPNGAELLMSIARFRIVTAQGKSDAKLVGTLMSHRRSLRGVT